MKLKTVLALVVKNQNSKTPVIVGVHELDILRLVHGGDDDDMQQAAVEVLEDKPPVEFYEVHDLDEEYARLKNYYLGTEQMPNPVRVVYPTVKSLAEAVVVLDDKKAK
jgi:hypothetical protein